MARQASQINSHLYKHHTLDKSRLLLKHTLLKYSKNWYSRNNDDRLCSCLFTLDQLLKKCLGLCIVLKYHIFKKRKLVFKKRKNDQKQSFTLNVFPKYAKTLTLSSIDVSMQHSVIEQRCFRDQLHTCTFDLRLYQCKKSVFTLFTQRLQQSKQSKYLIL